MITRTPILGQHRWMFDTLGGRAPKTDGFRRRLIPMRLSPALTRSILLMAVVLVWPAPSFGQTVRPLLIEGSSSVGQITLEEDVILPSSGDSGVVHRHFVVAVDPAGRYWVSSPFARGGVSVFSQDGERVAHFGDPGQAHKPGQEHDQLVYVRQILPFAQQMYAFDPAIGRIVAISEILTRARGSRFQVSSMTGRFCQMGPYSFLRTFERWRGSAVLFTCFRRMASFVSRSAATRMGFGRDRT